jgi:hypothetical protein
MKINRQRSCNRFFMQKNNMQYNITECCIRFQSTRDTGKTYHEQPSSSQLSSRLKYDVGLELTAGDNRLCGLTTATHSDMERCKIGRRFARVPRWADREEDKGMSVDSLGTQSESARIKRTVSACRCCEYT